MGFAWFIVGLVLGAAGTYYLLKIHPKIGQVYKDGIPK